MIRYKLRISIGPETGKFVNQGHRWTSFEVARFFTNYPAAAQSEGWEIVRVRVTKKPSKTKRALEVARVALKRINNVSDSHVTGLFAGCTSRDALNHIDNILAGLE